MTEPVNYTYRVINVNFDASYVDVAIDLPDGSEDEARFAIRQFATNDENFESELFAALDQMVTGYIMFQFPPPPPKPAKLLNMVNMDRTITI